MQSVELLLVLGSTVLCLLSALVVAYLRYHRSEAFKGDESAARKLILPAFEPLLWIIAAVNGLLASAFSAMLVASIDFACLPVVAAESVYATQQFVVLVVLVLLLQKSVCLPSLRRAVIVTFLLAAYMIPVAWLVHKLPANHTDTQERPRQTDSSFVAREGGMLLARLVVLALYAYVCAQPPDRASKRTLREYAAFAGVYHALLIATAEVFELRNSPKGSSVPWINSEQVLDSLMVVDLCWGLLSPFVVWRVLKADTEHWRGLGHSAFQQLQQRRARAPLILKRISSEGLHVLIEMHRKHVIDFAYLELKQRIGNGSSSAVFHGLLYSKLEVAVKVYSPPEFTDEVVASFSHEAALCGSLHHPNIVHFYGMCVSPPTICLVSERCRGNLEDVTTAMARHVERTGERSREQLLVDLGFMLDAARSVAYLHSFAPAFVHRDIKPSNFLVDFRNNVKLTDFGESRCLPRAQIAPRGIASGSTASTRTTATTATGDGARGPLPHTQAARSPAPVHFDAVTPQLTVKGTVDYMAPEIIRGHAGFASYGEAADVYALGITFWDILYPRCEKFPRQRSNHLHIFQAVLAGKRPQFERPTPGRSSTAATMSTELRHVIQLAWHQDAHQRPSAQRIVTLLERIQERECARFARDFRKDVPSKQTEPPRHDVSDDLAHEHEHNRHHHVGLGLGFNPLTQTTSVTGAFATKRMVELGVVQSSVEAVRLGNMLMDAGVLHHVKHSRPFEDTDSEVYFFDQYSIRLYDPVPILEDRCSDPPPKTNAVHLDSPTHTRSKKSKSHAILDALHLPAPSSSKFFTRQWAQHHNHTLFSRIAGLRLHHHHHHHRDRHNDDSQVGDQEHERAMDATFAGAGAGGAAAAVDAGERVDEFVDGFQSCRCRKLSQRTEEPKASLGHRFRERFGFHHHPHHLHLSQNEQHHHALLTTHLLTHDDALHPDFHDRLDDDSAYELHGSPHPRQVEIAVAKQKRAGRFAFARVPEPVATGPELPFSSDDELQVQLAD